MSQGRYRPAVASFALAVAFSVVTGCSNAPPPPLVPAPLPGTPSTSAAPTKPALTEVVVGVDQIEGGFNPHTLADLSPTSSALASLVLPSVFRPAEDGSLRLDTTLMDSAEVVPGQDKFTVRYEIRKEAGWSDGAPIAAEDFVYLWQQLRSQPGVANPAGYQLIEDVQSRSGGKAVQVTFAKPYPGWQSLFSNLLPAHLLKDAPRRWNEALDNGYPASGGPFAFRQVDLARGEIILERNDRYWGRPAVSDRIVLRASSQGNQLAALRSGDSHVALFGADASTLSSLRELGDSVRLATVPRPATMQLVLRRNSPQMSDLKVRQAVTASLNRQALIDAGSGGGPASQYAAHAQVLAPSEREYAPTEPGDSPSKPDPGRVSQLLTEAGYQRVGGVWTRDGRPLNLVIAAPFEHKQYVRIAEETAKELVQQGIQATAVTPTGDQLFGEQLSANPLSSPKDAAAVDLAVAPRPAGDDPATMLASEYGCPRADTENEQPFPYNPAGFCDPLLQPTIEAAMDGQIPFAQASSQVEGQLWAQAVAVPLYQQAQVLAVGPRVMGIAPGNGFAGPFSTAAQWLGTPVKNDGY